MLTPATVEDAYSMLLEAVAIDDPVIFCEHKFLYYHLKAEKLPSEALPVGKARIAREGRDMTIVAYSAMVQDALEAAAELAPEGWEVEVVDLRSVKPLDTDTVMASVARTGRLLCVGEAWPWGGVTAEVIARVTSEGYGLLDAPPQRLNAKDTPGAVSSEFVDGAPPDRAQHCGGGEKPFETLKNLCRKFPSSCRNWANPSPRPKLSISWSSRATPSRPDQDLIEVETNKATMTVTSPCRGRLKNSPRN